jgi:hypothetical protein
MKAVLKFDLSNPEDQQEFYRVNKSLNMAVAIWEFDQWLRGEYKHGENEHAYVFRENFREFLTDNDIDIERLLQ